MQPTSANTLSQPAINRFQLRHVFMLPALAALVLVMLACAASPTSSTKTATGTATAIGGSGGPGAGSTATPGSPANTPQPNAPTSTPKPNVPTNTPIPANITGQYTGTYTSGSATGEIDLKVMQSNNTLSGVTNEGGSIANDSGAMGAGGNFAITETFTSDGHTATLQGHIINNGLSGTWSSIHGSGNWTVTLVGNIGGVYAGTYTSYASTGSYPIMLDLSQVGSILTGSTTEGSNTASDTGKVATNGTFSITESFSGGGTAYLVGAMYSGNHLSGTWNNGGAAQGNWTVGPTA